MAEGETPYLIAKGSRGGVERLPHPTALRKAPHRLTTPDHFGVTTPSQMVLQRSHCVPYLIPQDFGKLEEATMVRFARSCVVPHRPVRYTCGDTWAADALIREKARKFRRNFDAEGWPSGRWRWS